MTQHIESEEKPNIIVVTKRLVYLAGPVELEDTWRERAKKALAKINLETISGVFNFLCIRQCKSCSHCLGCHSVNTAYLIEFCWI